jgi:hypothetical protein
MKLSVVCSIFLIVVVVVTLIHVDGLGFTPSSQAKLRRKKSTMPIGWFDRVNEPVQTTGDKVRWPSSGAAAHVEPGKENLLFALPSPGVTTAMISEENGPSSPSINAFGNKIRPFLRN